MVLKEVISAELMKALSQALWDFSKIKNEISTKWDKAYREKISKLVARIYRDPPPPPPDKAKFKGVSFTE